MLAKRFTTIEIKEIVKAWLLVSLMFAIAMGGWRGILTVLPITLATAGAGFLFHELAHKFVAQRAKCYAEFKANDQALLIGVLLSFTGFILAAPGGVYIRGATHRQHGQIALAGPLTNVVLAALFWLITPIFPLVGAYGHHINALLAVFNLLPFPPFDGHAVFSWNKLAWGVSIVVSGALFVAATI